MCQPAPVPAPCCTEVTNDKTPLSAYWQDGLWLSSTNSDFKIHVGGRMQYDAFDAFDVQSRVINGTGGLKAPAGSDSTEFWDESQGFRRARVRIDGTIYDSVDFVWEYDFATAMNPHNFQTVQGGPAGDVVLNNASSVFTGTGMTDMNVTLKYLPWVQNISVGSFLVPFSFDLTTSDRWMDFIERSCAFDAFVPATNSANYTLVRECFGWNEAQTLTYPAPLRSTTCGKAPLASRTPMIHVQRSRYSVALLRRIDRRAVSDRSRDERMRGALCVGSIGRRWPRCHATSGPPLHARVSQPSDPRSRPTRA